jgi:hypothetical protein
LAATDLQKRVLRRAESHNYPMENFVTISLHRAGRASALGCLFNRGVYLRDPPVQIGHDAGLHRNTRLDVGGPAGNRQIAGKGVADVSLGEEAVGADRVEPHQDGHQDDQRRPQAVP